ncbi:MAG: hypothetical protein JKY18_13785 [Flavobacteriales bacterium]|nr:hypothetical protein [Flavobacteriales bacterium]
MKCTSTLLAMFFLLGFLTNAYSQNDEKYYYKLGKKYMITKDYKTAARHFSKCMGIAEKNKNENPNYYYYPLLLYYYGIVKTKVANRAAKLITELVPESPNIPTSTGSSQEKYFNKFFGGYGIEIDRSDYIFIRHYLHFQSNEMDVIETFDRMEFAVRYHSKESVIPLEVYFTFMKDIYMKGYEKDVDPEASAAPFKLRLCGVFTRAAKEGNVEAEKLVSVNCK